MVKPANGVSIQVGLAQLENALEQLPMEGKLAVYRRLEHVTHRARLDDLLRRIRRRARRYRFSERELKAVCDEVRQELHAERPRPRH